MLLIHFMIYFPAIFNFLYLFFFIPFMFSVYVVVQTFKVRIPELQSFSLNKYRKYGIIITGKKEQ
jgi:hypothetical protein